MQFYSLHLAKIIETTKLKKDLIVKDIKRMEGHSNEYGIATSHGVYFIRPHIENETRFSEYMDEHYLYGTNC